MTGASVQISDKYPVPAVHVNDDEHFAELEAQTTPLATLFSNCCISGETRMLADRAVQVGGQTGWCRWWLGAVLVAQVACEVAGWGWEALGSTVSSMHLLYILTQAHSWLVQ